MAPAGDAHAAGRCADLAIVDPDLGRHVRGDLHGGQEALERPHRALHLAPLRRVGRRLLEEAAVVLERLVVAEEPLVGAGDVEEDQRAGGVLTDEVVGPHELHERGVVVLLIEQRRPSVQVLARLHHVRRILRLHPGRRDRQRQP